MARFTRAKLGSKRRCGMDGLGWVGLRGGWDGLGEGGLGWIEEDGMDGWSEVGGCGGMERATSTRKRVKNVTSRTCSAVMASIV